MGEAPAQCHHRDRIAAMSVICRRRNGHSSSSFHKKCMIHMIHPYDTCIICLVFADRLMLPQAKAQGDTYLDVSMYQTADGKSVAISCVRYSCKRFVNIWYMHHMDVSYVWLQLVG